MPAQQAFKTREPLVYRVSDLMRSVSGRKRIARVQNASADVVKVDQLTFGDGEGQRWSSLLMPGRNLVGRRHWHREKSRIHLPQLVDYATEPPVFCEGLVVLGIEFFIGDERPERDQLTDLTHLQEDRLGAHKVLIPR